MFNTIIIPYQNDWLFFGTKKSPNEVSYPHGHFCTVFVAPIRYCRSTICYCPFIVLETEFWNHNGQITSGKEDALALNFGCVESFVLFLAFLLWYPIFWSVPIQGIVNSIHWENRHTCGIYFGQQMTIDAFAENLFRAFFFGFCTMHWINFFPFLEYFHGIWFIIEWKIWFASTNALKIHY